MQSMDGKTCLVTGGTNGIGKQTALELAKLGATVVIVGRNRQKTAEVVTEIKAAAGHDQVEGLIADLSLMEQVRHLTEEFKAKYRELHVLINNAGAIFFEKQMTAEGHEMTFALNHLSYFVLTNLLLEMLKASAPARVINVSSGAHRMGRLDFNDLEFNRGYAGFRAYGRSKLMNIIFTYDLAERLHGTGVTVNALHPGFVRTGFGKNTQSNLIKWVFGGIQRLALKPEDGAQTSVYLASSPEVEGLTGKYFHQKQPVKSSAESYQKDHWQRLWEVSAQITGVGELERA